KYTLVRRLAAGGVAELHLARHTAADGRARLVVLKRIPPRIAAEPDFARMFVEEARAAARLEHRNIVRIEDLGQLEDFYFLTMEYVHGEDLRAIARQVDARETRMPMEHACRILA